MQCLRREAAALGFSQIGVAPVDLTEAEPGLLAWLAAGCHGDMDYMARHGLRRARPAELVPGTLSVITARMDYLPRAVSGAGASGDGPGVRDPGDPADQADQADQADRAADWRAVEWARLARPEAATVSLYARGRDYHKVLRRRLQRLAERLQAEVGPFGHRVFTDSAPLLEVELAVRSGLGWRGRHTLVLDRQGSMGFLGEICIDLALPPTPPVQAHCGQCRACLDVCPTGAIVAPYRLDARRCLSYLTIEHEGAIPVEWRPALGNRIYGCDDCQLACPWNKFAQRSPLPDFDPREDLADPTLLALWAWDEAAFLHRTEGSAIRRIGYRRWRRNLAVALGNLLRAPAVPAALRAAVQAALAAARDAADPLLREHLDWALAAG
ncbi:tRNA epoxyqueuosine(34) reductase QueG [Piscinibacter sakaiensis]|nr:tRNA epoxyqueuosine(34) reductase QueG [Piscinibacter sakaiensis]